MLTLARGIPEIEIVVSTMVAFGGGGEMRSVQGFGCCYRRGDRSSRSRVSGSRAVTMCISCNCRMETSAAGARAGAMSLCTIRVFTVVGVMSGVVEIVS